MRALITRSTLLLFATAMIALVIADNLKTAGANAMKLNSRKPESSMLKEGETPALPDIAEPNPLLAQWQGPYGGVPPFDKVQVSLFKPALEAAMTEQLAEVEKIAKDTTAPTFENTIVAMERAGQTLDRVITIYGVWGSTMASPEFQVVQREMAPKLAAFNDKITQNEALFKRIELVYNSPAKKKLSSEQQRLVWLDYTNFVRSGAKLNGTDKARLSQINQQLAGLFTKFSQNVLAEEDGQFVALKSEADLAGLPQSVRDAAAAAATTKKQEGWLISNTRSSVDPFLTYSDRRDLREKVWRMFIMRGDNGDEHDNNSTITQILQLRAERAKLLGYPTHAHWRLEDQMAKTPERAVALMEAVWKPAVARVHEEVGDMQAIADREKAGIRIAPWDYRFYAEKVRKAKYDLDENDVKPYLQLEKLREGMFWVAGELFGFKLVPVTDGSVPVYQPDVRVFEVQDQDGKRVGLWYFDPYARPGKNSGAWMNEYRPQSQLLDQPVIVSNNANFVKGKSGEPILVSWDDADTLFHEFGHALHGLNSNVVYPQLAGTNVPRDYVEFPSQLLERWLSTRPVLDQFALHFQTGQPVPAALGMPREIVMRHRTAQFHHIFADGYEAGYYSYLWSDTLSADAYEAFLEGSGPYDKAMAKRLHDNVFSVGNTVDPAEGYRAFRGHDAGIGAL